MSRMFCHKSVVNTCVEGNCPMWVTKDDGKGDCVEALIKRLEFYDMLARMGNDNK